MRSFLRGCCLSITLCAAAFAGNTDAQNAAGDPVALASQALQAAHPGVRDQSLNSNNRLFYGKPMTPAASADEAAATWLDLYADAWGVPNVQLELVRSHEVGFGKFTVYAFEQTMDGAPVEGAWARLVVLNGDQYEVVMASADLAARPATEQRAIAVSADAAVGAVRALPAYAALPDWSAPEQVVYFDPERGIQGTWAWRFVGQDHEIETRAMFTFFVDVTSGAILEERDEIQTVDVDGTVMGMATPGLLPDIASNPEVSLPMFGARASIGASFDFADATGAFTIANAGSSSVTVNTGVVNGQWGSVDNTAGAEITASVGVTPPGPANLTLNAAPSEFTTSQTNALRHVTLIHNFFRDRAPSFPGGIDVSIPCFVNWNSAGGITSCNAFFDPGGVTLNFFREKDGCVNSAYSTVVAHEYGHFVVQTLGLSQGGFGEGFGDSCAVLLHDTGIIGQNFFLSGGNIRNINTATTMYPCSAEGHTCGQVLARVWRNIRNNFGATYGAATGLSLAQQLMVDWSQITGGGSGSNAAHPNTAIEVLVADDDDGDIENGTPNYADICAAFSNRNIPCPPLALIDFVYPDGLPTLADPGQPTPIDVNVIALAGTPTPGSGTVSYRIGGGAYTTVPMTQNTPNHYTATLPAATCGASIEYYFTSGSSGGNVSDPPNAPSSVFSVTAGEATAIPYSDDMEADAGWTVGGPGDDATTGIWTRVNPNGTAAQPEDDHTANPGVRCWVTGQGSVGGGLGDADVDGGQTTLTSPAYDLSNVASATIGYWRWYSNDTGGAPNADVFVVQVSNGGAWVTAETVGPSGPETSGGWFYHEFRVESIVTLSATVRVRFIASDEGTGSLVEAAVDDLAVTTISCDATPPCTGDLNGDEVVDLEDLSVQLSNFGMSGVDPEDGDLDGDGDVDLTDMSLMLAVFGTSC